jgi:hypothetical protein
MTSDRPEIVIEFNAFPALSANIARLADVVCERTALAVEANAKLLIQNPPKTGRIYRHGKIEHQASAPWQAPATDTGNLVNTALTERKAEADWEVGFTAEYAAGLEFGTARILPRPYLRPSVEKHRQGFLDAMSAIAGMRDADLPDAAGAGGAM